MPANSFRPSTLALSLIGALGLVASQPTLGASTYQFTSFDGPGDHAGGTTVNGIDNQGDVVGFSANAGASRLTNFIRSPGGTFSLLNIAGAADAMANGINSSRTVVGASGDNAFLLSNGLLSILASSGILATLPPVNPGKTASEIAFGINDSGSIVGQYVDSVSGNTPGFVDANDRFTVVSPVPDAMVTNVQGINNHGLAIGFYSTDGTHQHGFLYDTLGQFTLLLPDPSTARTTSGGLVLTQFLGINDNNEAVGYYQTTNGSQFGFLFDLKTQTYTFLDEPEAAPVNGVQITQITGIDGAGEIAGFYIDAGGAQHGFVAAQPSAAQP